MGSQRPGSGPARPAGLNDLEQIENAPEYDPDEKLTAEKLKRYLQAPSATHSS